VRLRWLYIFLAIVCLVSVGILGSLYSFLYANCPDARPLGSGSHSDNFVFDRIELADSAKLLILVPGALNSIDGFASARTLSSRGFATAFYRFPGMDGRPLDQVVSIADIAQEVVDFTSRFPAKEVSIVGFSIGGQVALEAAARSKGRIKKVVVLGGSTGFPSTFGAGFRALGWVASRAWAMATIDFAAVWKDFYKVLLFGEAGVTDPELSRRSDEIIAARRAKIVTPTRALVCSHMRDITFRAAVDSTDVGDTPILFVHGRWDIVSPVEGVAAYARQFKASRFVILERQGHQIFLTERALFERVGEFLSD